MRKGFRRARWCALAALYVCFIGCNSLSVDPPPPSNPGTAQGRETETALPSPGDEPVPAEASSVVIGDSCRASDLNHICLALKYVAYEDSKGNPVVSQASAIKNVQIVNHVWNQCNLGFQIEEFVAVNPALRGLAFDTANTGELDHIRSDFVEPNRLLVVTTGTWNRKGSLGDTGANAWTAMPEQGPFGTVLESPVGTFANIIAHELGHYLNLLHVNDNADLMNPIIYDTSTVLSSDQCQSARFAASGYWARMLR